jgi:hypothetical protein
MERNIVELKKSKMEPCETVIIKDPWYERDTWCAFQSDDCSLFTHAKALASCFTSHYKDEEMEFDHNVTSFALFMGTDEFVSIMEPRIEDDGYVGIYSRLNKSLITKTVTEIGCDTAQFSFGTPETFDAFSLHTGADGGIGSVHLYKDTTIDKPIGLFFVGSVDADMITPNDIIGSFVAAFNIERQRENSLQSHIDKAENSKASSPRDDKDSKDKNFEK